MSGAETEWTLAWPRELFVSEAQAVLSTASLLAGPAPVVERAHWLLAEAFQDAEVAERFMRIAQREPLPKKVEPMVLSSILPSQMRKKTTVYPGPLQFLYTLVLRAPDLRNRPAWRPYHHDKAFIETGVFQPWTMARREVAELIDELLRRGYLPTFASPSCDGPQKTEEDVRALLATSANLFGVWPPLDTFLKWSEQSLYGLIEFVFDQVRRPRRASPCDKCSVYISKSTSCHLLRGCTPGG